LTAKNSQQGEINMNNQFPRIDWYARPDSWTYRMPGFSPFPGSWRVPTPPLAASDTSYQNEPIDYSADEPSNRGILGQFSKPIEPPASPSAWNATFSVPRQLNTEPVNFLPADHPAFRIKLPSYVEPMPPAVPFYRADGSRVDPMEAAWQPPEPPKDWRTRMREALSDKNIRYYAGPGFSQFLENLAGLVPMLPGSGMVESQQDAREARNDFESGNYGKAAAHLASGTANVGLDVLPGGKQLALLAGMSARTFPWVRLPLAEAMEKAGKSVDEIWRATGLERGVDRKWRFEISDRGYRVDPNAGVLGSDGFRVAPLYDQQRHPGMREAFPDLASARSEIRLDPGLERNRGHFMPGQRLVSTESPLRELLRNTGIHELQHMIDYIEGFARGGSALEFVRLGYARDMAKALYNRLAGEVAARNAEYRLGMSDAARMRKAPIRTEEKLEIPVPRDQQIVRFYGQPY
jgi:hypothetical protein